ncbi:peptidase M28, partial [Sphaerimonospora cavernae]
MNPTMRSGAVAVLAAVALTTTSLTAATAASASGTQAFNTQASNTQASAPTPPPAFSPPNAQQSKSAIASADKALAGDTAALYKSADDEFKLVRSIAGTRGLQYLSYQRSYRGLPVYGGDVIVATDKTGQSVDT